MQIILNLPLDLGVSSPIFSKEGEEGDVITEHKTKIIPPKKYKVLLHNDDYTTMDFVVMILKNVFHKSDTEAIEIMMHVHEKGVGVCGIYTHEIAEMKVMKVAKVAKAEGHPLLCTMEEE